MNAYIFIWFAFSFSSSYSFSVGDLASLGLDLVPIIGNLKSAYELYTGEDLITGEKLTSIERTLCLVGIIPLGNYLRIGRHFKNAEKFFKAGERAKKAGKFKNAWKFFKASFRAKLKANFFQKIFKNVIKGIKFILRLFRLYRNKDEESDL